MRRAARTVRCTSRFGKDRAFYATEFQTGGLNEGPAADPAGDVVRIGRHGHRTHLGVGKP